MGARASARQGSGLRRPQQNPARATVPTGRCSAAARRGAPARARTRRWMASARPLPQVHTPRPTLPCFHARTCLPLPKPAAFARWTHHRNDLAAALAPRVARWVWAGRGSPARSLARARSGGEERTGGRSAGGGEGGRRTLSRPCASPAPRAATLRSGTSSPPPPRPRAPSPTPPARARARPSAIGARAPAPCPFAPCLNPGLAAPLNGPQNKKKKAGRASIQVQTLVRRRCRRRARALPTAFHRCNLGTRARK